jgi:hypothetical protein
MGLTTTTDKDTIWVSTGGNLTSLNLFTTKFDRVLLNLVEKQAEMVECVHIVIFTAGLLIDSGSHVIFDTPGEIEIFYMVYLVLRPPVAW